MIAWATKKSFVVVYRIVSRGSGCHRQCRPVATTYAAAAMTKKSFVIVNRIVSGGSGCRRQCRPVATTSAAAHAAAAHAAAVMVAWVTKKSFIIVYGIVRGGSGFRRQCCPVATTSAATTAVTAASVEWVTILTPRAVTIHTVTAGRGRWGAAGGGGGRVPALTELQSASVPEPTGHERTGIGAQHLVFAQP